LGILNLQTFGWALQIRWLWTQKTDPTKLWVGLQIQVPKNDHALFNMAVDSIMGNGESTLFWKDRWLHGHTISELAPNLIKVIPKRTINRRTVA
jgi:hypothetical protein